MEPVKKLKNSMINNKYNSATNKGSSIVSSKKTTSELTNLKTRDNKLVHSTIQSKKDIYKLTSSMINNNTNNKYKINTNELPLFKDDQSTVTESNLNEDKKDKVKSFIQPSINNDTSIKTRSINPRQNQKSKQNNQVSSFLKNASTDKSIKIKGNRKGTDFSLDKSNNKIVSPDYAQSVIVNPRQYSSFNNINPNIKKIHGNSTEFVNAVLLIKDILFQTYSKSDFILYNNEINIENRDKYALDQTLTLNSICYDIDNLEKSISILKEKIENQSEILSLDYSADKNKELLMESNKRTNKYTSLFDSCKNYLTDIIEILDNSTKTHNIAFSDNTSKRKHKPSVSLTTLPYLKDKDSSREKKVKFSHNKMNSSSNIDFKLSNEIELGYNRIEIKSQQSILEDDQENEKEKIFKEIGSKEQKENKLKFAIENISIDESVNCDLSDEDSINLNNESIIVNKIFFRNVEVKINKDIFIRNFFEQANEINKTLVSKNSFDNIDNNEEEDDSYCSLKENEIEYDLLMNKNKMNSKVFKSRKLYNIKRSKSLLNIQNFIPKKNSSELLPKQSKLMKKNQSKTKKLVSINKKVSGIKIVEDIKILSDSDSEHDKSIEINNTKLPSINTTTKRILSTKKITSISNHDIVKVNLKDKETDQKCLIF